MDSRRRGSKKKRSSSKSKKASPFAQPLPSLPDWHTRAGSDTERTSSRTRNVQNPAVLPVVSPRANRAAKNAASRRTKNSSPPTQRPSTSPKPKSSPPSRWAQQKPKPLSPVHQSRKEPKGRRGHRRLKSLPDVPTVGLGLLTSAHGDVLPYGSGSQTARGSPPRRRGRSISGTHDLGSVPTAGQVGRALFGDIRHHKDALDMQFSGSTADDDVGNIRAQFGHYDTNGNGLVSVSELKRMMASMGTRERYGIDFLEWAQPQLLRMFGPGVTQASFNRVFTLFIKLYNKWLSMEGAEADARSPKPLKLFDSADHDRDGVVSVKELQDATYQLHKQNEKKARHLQDRRHFEDQRSKLAHHEAELRRQKEAATRQDDVAGQASELRERAAILRAKKSKDKDRKRREQKMAEAQWQKSAGEQKRVRAFDNLVQAIERCRASRDGNALTFAMEFAEKAGLGDDVESTRLIAQAQTLLGDIEAEVSLHGGLDKIAQRLRDAYAATAEGGDPTELQEAFSEASAHGLSKNSGLFKRCQQLLEDFASEPSKTEAINVLEAQIQLSRESRDATDLKKAHEAALSLGVNKTHRALRVSKHLIGEIAEEKQLRELAEQELSRVIEIAGPKQDIKAVTAAIAKTAHIRGMEDSEIVRAARESVRQMASAMRDVSTSLSMLRDVMDTVKVSRNSEELQFAIERAEVAGAKKNAGTLIEARSLLGVLRDEFARNTELRAHLDTLIAGAKSALSSEPGLRQHVCQSAVAKIEEALDDPQLKVLRADDSKLEETRNCVDLLHHEVDRISFEAQKLASVVSECEVSRDLDRLDEAIAVAEAEASCVPKSAPAMVEAQKLKALIVSSQRKHRKAAHELQKVIPTVDGALNSSPQDRYSALKVSGAALRQAIVVCNTMKFDPSHVAYVRGVELEKEVTRSLNRISALAQQVEECIQEAEATRDATSLKSSLKRAIEGGVPQDVNGQLAEDEDAAQMASVLSTANALIKRLDREAHERSPLGQLRSAIQAATSALVAGKIGTRAGVVARSLQALQEAILSCDNVSDSASSTTAEVVKQAKAAETKLIDALQNIDAADAVLAAEVDGAKSILDSYDSSDDFSAMDLLEDHLTNLQRAVDVARAAAVPFDEDDQQPPASSANMVHAQSLIAAYQHLLLSHDLRAKLVQVANDALLSYAAEAKDNEANSSAKLQKALQTIEKGLVELTDTTAGLAVRNLDDTEVKDLAMQLKSLPAKHALLKQLRHHRLVLNEHDNGDRILDNDDGDGRPGTPAATDFASTCKRTMEKLQQASLDVQAALGTAMDDGLKHSKHHRGYDGTSPLMDDVENGGTLGAYDAAEKSVRDAHSFLREIAVNQKFTQKALDLVTRSRQTSSSPDQWEPFVREAKEALMGWRQLPMCSDVAQHLQSVVEDFEHRVATAKAEKEAAAKAKAEAEAAAKAKAEAEAKAKAEAEAKIKAAAKAKAEAQAKAKAAALQKVRAQAEASSKAEAEAQAKLEQVAQETSKDAEDAEATLAKELERIVAEGPTGTGWSAPLVSFMASNVAGKIQAASDAADAAMAPGDKIRLLRKRHEAIARWTALGEAAAEEPVTNSTTGSPVVAWAQALVGTILEQSRDSLRDKQSQLLNKKLELVANPTSTQPIGPVREIVEVLRREIQQNKGRGNYDEVVDGNHSLPPEELEAAEAMCDECSHLLTIRSARLVQCGFRALRARVWFRNAIATARQEAGSDDFVPSEWVVDTTTRHLVKRVTLTNDNSDDLKDYSDSLQKGKDVEDADIAHSAFHMSESQLAHHDQADSSEYDEFDSLEEKFLIAVERNDAVMVNKFIADGVDVQTINSDGYNALMVAASFDCDSVVASLVEAGVDMNLVAPNDTTAVILCAYTGSFRCLKAIFAACDRFSRPYPELEAVLGSGCTALYLAAQEGCVDSIETLLHAKADLEHASADGVTPLFVAIHEGHTDAVASLVTDETINQRNIHSLTPLYVAVQNAVTDTVQLLLSLKADPNMSADDGSTPAEVSVFVGVDECLRSLLEAKADASHARAIDGNSLLMLAAYKARFEMLREIYQAGADLFHKNAKGQNVADILFALHDKQLADVGLPDEEAFLIGCENDDVDIVSECIHAGTDINSTNCDGLSGLGLACYFNCPNVTSVLCRHKADPNLYARSGTSPLHLAVNENHTAIIDALLDSYSESELDQSHTMAHGCTALYLACQEGFHEVVDKLLSHSLKALNLCKDGNISPLYIAAHEGHEDTVRHLVQAKAELDIRNDRGATALYIAVQRNHTPICRTILEAGADPNIATLAMSSPLAVAVFHFNPKIVALLLTHGAYVDDPSSDGTTVAMLSAHSLDVDILCQLVLHGSSLNVRNHAGHNVDAILRLAHGIGDVHIALYSLLVSAGAQQDARTIKNMFKSIDEDGNEEITLSELKDGLEKWGLKSKFGEGFDQFVTGEFRRINKDGDDAVSFKEFRASFSRFHREHRELLSLSSSNTEDVAVMKDLFNSIDRNRDGEITAAELRDSLLSWGLQAKYGDGFDRFAAAEFDRLNQNGDHAVNFSEFRACFSRFHLLFRSSQANAVAKATASPGTDSAAGLGDNVPQWLRDAAERASARVWSAIQSGEKTKVLPLPKNWRTYVINERFDHAENSSDANVLSHLLGFDVEEVDGWANPGQLTAAERIRRQRSQSQGLDSFSAPVPLKGTTYLRVKHVDKTKRGRREGTTDHIEVGDILVGLFGRDIDALHSRDEFVLLCEQLPVCHLHVYRPPN